MTRRKQLPYVHLTSRFGSCQRLYPVDSAIVAGFLWHNQDSLWSIKGRKIQGLIVRFLYNFQDFEE
jgi:hypothetical protein